MTSFDKEIQQSKFQSHIQRATLNVMFTSNFIRDKTMPFFKEFGILQQHYNILRIVRGKKGEPVSPGKIIEVMLDKGRDLTRLVDKLVKVGYLERKTCPSNRRRVDIYITEKGIEITNNIESRIVAWYSKLGLTPTESQQLNELLDKLRT